MITTNWLIYVLYIIIYINGINGILHIYIYTCLYYTYIGQVLPTSYISIINNSCFPSGHFQHLHGQHFAIALCAVVSTGDGGTWSATRRSG